MKDILFVLDAFSHYHETHSQVQLCVIGPVLDRDYADTVFARIPEENVMSLPPNYEFKGERDAAHQVKGVYYVALFHVLGVTCSPIPHSLFLDTLLDVDLVINTSLSEGLAAVTLEAASAGKIMLARNNSGNASVIQNGVNGLLFDSPPEFIQLVDKLFSDNDYRAKLEASTVE